MKFSVVTPSLNQERFIERTIQSVLSQGIPDLEYLVVDGDSRDGTLEILDRYAGRLTWISEPDRGQADAVNKGLGQTTGEIIGWLNSDDLYLPEALRTVLEIFEGHPELDLVYGDAYHIDEEDRILEEYPVEDWDFDRLLEACIICQPAAFFRREAIERHGPLNPDLDFCMDYEFWIRLAQGGAKFLRWPKFLACSRMYARNKTMSARVRVHREINSMLRSRLGVVPDRWVFNYAHAWADQYCSRDGRLRFRLLVSLASWASAIRWNRSVSSHIRRTTLGWIRDSLKKRWRRGP